MTPVARYVLVFHPSFSLPTDRTKIVDHAQVVGHGVSPGSLAVTINHWTTEGISLALPTDKDNTDTFETNMPQEQSARECAYIMVSN